MNAETFEAIGQRGEACLIHRRRSALAGGEALASYSLASGERLRKTDQDGEFEAWDGKRKFRLRQPRQLDV